MLNRSLVIKRLLCRILLSSGMARHAINRLHQDHALILMYHRILPQGMVGDGPLEPGMYVTEESFARHLSCLAQYFDILPLSSVVCDSIPMSYGKGKPRCAITFDDGWLDFLLHAFPVLKRFNAPATVFLPTSFIGTDKEFWTDAVAKVLRHEQRLRQVIAASAHADRLRVNIVVEGIFRAEAAGEEKRRDQVISGLKRHRAEEIYWALEELQTLGAVDASGSRVFLNWDEVRSLKDTGLVTFGSHTADHNILTTLQADEVCRELSQSKERLIAEKGVFPEEPVFFCYPNGNANSEIAAMVEAVGYVGAVTTKKGWNGPGANRFLLNRVGLHEDMSSSHAMFACRLAGFI